MLAFLKRYRELLLVAALLLLPLGTWIANAQRGRELSAFDKFCLAATAPVRLAAERAVGGTLDLWQRYVALRGVEEENRLLRETVAELQSRLNAAAEAERENERLRALVEFSQEEEGRMVAAPVVGVAPSHRRTILLAKGERDGVAVGMPVVTADGVVGKVAATYGRTSEVQLVVDASSAVAGRIQRSRARLTVRGRGDDQRMALANVLRTDDVQEGDVVVTSGTDGVFPKGLVIGRVGSLVRKPYGMVLEGDVLPAVDVAGLEEVLIVIASDEEEEGPTAWVDDGLWLGRGGR